MNETGTEPVQPETADAAENQKIHSVLYVSAPTRPLNAEAVAEILSVARPKNAKTGITGGLLWAEDWFCQLLEGTHEQVETLMERIESDPRHERVTRILESDTSGRRFTDWTMGATPVVSRKACSLIRRAFEDPDRVRDDVAIVAFSLIGDLGAPKEQHAVN